MNDTIKRWEICAITSWLPFTLTFEALPFWHSLF
jgi:hypothetical protein